MRLPPPEKIAAICAKSASESIGAFMDSRKYDDLNYAELTRATANIATGACNAGFAISLEILQQEGTFDEKARFFSHFVEVLQRWREGWDVRQGYGIVVADPPYQLWEEWAQ